MTEIWLMNRASITYCPTTTTNDEKSANQYGVSLNFAENFSITSSFDATRATEMHGHSVTTAQFGIGWVKQPNNPVLQVPKEFPVPGALGALGAVVSTCAAYGA
ncbi:hypothetical protein GN958_ATG01772 [Phytophthora infestans]|uniref:Uncharacterized protein n=1 Tax=Phytophthora infestans TaxID=4787 RepID=A0A8S9VEF6_PHYIN|nr:hypothetical protein GN958_ATG01772 [Phytophthora infestans]